MALQTARDYLADNDLAIRGARGKLSNAAKEHLAAALAKGIKFSDWDENGKIKEEVTKRYKPRAEKAEKPDLEPGMYDLSVPEHEPSEMMKRIWHLQKNPKQRTQIRPENAIKSIDSAGVVIVQSLCREGHFIGNCSCAEIKPSDYINAVSSELIVSEHA